MVTATSGATGPYCVASSPPPSPAQKRKPACEQAPQRKAHSVAGLTSTSLSRLGFSELETVRQSSDLPAASSVFSTETGANFPRRPGRRISMRRNGGNYPALDHDRNSSSTFPAGG